MKFTRKKSEPNTWLVIGLINICLMGLWLSRDTTLAIVWVAIGILNFLNAIWGYKTPVAKIEDNILTWNRAPLRSQKIDLTEIQNLTQIKPLKYQVRLTSGKTIKVFLNHFVENEIESFIGEIQKRLVTQG